MPHRHGRPITQLPPALGVALSVVLFSASVVVMCAIAGFSAVGRSFHPGLSPWFALAFGAEAVAFLAYLFAYRAVAAIDHGPELTLREATRFVAVGFGTFLLRGGAQLDEKAFGRGEEGEVRVLALDALEHAPLAPAACAASIFLLAQGRRTPGLDFTVPWATLVPLGALLAAYGVRHRGALQDSHGWRSFLWRILEGIRLLFRLAADIRHEWPAFAGAALYWAGDVVCLWASLEPFHAAPQFAPVIMAHAVGYVLTRRTLPAAGTGIVEVLMPLTLVACGAPFAGAILGVLVYRLFNLWLPLLPALVALPGARRALGAEA